MTPVNHTCWCSSVVEQRRDAFWSRVGVSEKSKCWPWLASAGRAGYGAFWLNGKCEGAHRVALMLSGVRIKPGQVVMHICDNRLCCNPSHLRPASQSENMIDCVTKGRHAKVGSKGSFNGAAKLSESDVAEMRALHSSGASIRSLSRRFQVSRPTAASAIRGETWKHV